MSFTDLPEGTTHYDFDSCERCQNCHGHFVKTNLQGLCDTCTIELTTKSVGEQIK